METNLIAAFSDMLQVEQAIGALRIQGAIEIRVRAGRPEETGPALSGGRPACCVNV
jgi:hypothetical protein